MAPYEEVILDHWRNPRNRGRISNPDLAAVEANPLCGDVVRLEVKLKDGVVEEAKFDGHGCAISQAAASLLTELIVGKSVAELKHLSDEALLAELGGVIKTRLNCALLPLRALRKGLSTAGK
jgi:nitrogen fixation NifU-like protein